MTPAPLDLDAAEALANAATAGPWSAHCRHVNGPAADSPALADWPRDEFLQCEVDGPEEPCGRGAFYGPDARFIAAARTLVPQLVAALREAERDARRLGPAASGVV